MKDAHNTKKQGKKTEELHFELQGWKSSLHFIEDEIIFIDHLLNSYVFQPNTQNLFERLEDYNYRLKQLKHSKTNFQKSIAQHENQLSGMMDCTDAYCDLQYYQKHNTIKAQVRNFSTNFSTLKSEIFNYASAILKKRKPAIHP